MRSGSVLAPVPKTESKTALKLSPVGKFPSAEAILDATSCGVILTPDSIIAIADKIFVRKVGSFRSNETSGFKFVRLDTNLM